MNKMIFIIYFLLSFIYTSELYIISDYDFTNQNFTFKQTSNFVKHWPHNRFTSNQIHIFYKASRIYQLHVLIPLTRASVEQDILENQFIKKDYNRAMVFAMSYGLNIKTKDRKEGEPYFKYRGFKMQILKGCELKRKSFDLYYIGATRILLDENRTIIPKNAATYSSYWYTPYYGKHRHYENILMWGNELFELRYKRYKKAWNMLIKREKENENKSKNNPIFTPLSIQ
ncbi:MAG: hypothetical protein IID03_12815 [Candidatus Dadabacteria bacterium]|nr:hypothetical protein [Candidatus Dadabacteria bacterium]